MDPPLSPSDGSEIPLPAHSPYFTPAANPSGNFLKRPSVLQNIDSFIPTGFKFSTPPKPPGARKPVTTVLPSVSNLEARMRGSNEARQLDEDGRIAIPRVGAEMEAEGDGNMPPPPLPPPRGKTQMGQKRKLTEIGERGAMGRKEAPAEGAGSGGYSQDLGGGYFGIDQQGHSQSGRDMQDLGHGQDGWNMGRNLQELEHGQAGDRSWNFELGTGGQAQNMGQGFEQNFELFRDVGRHPLEDGALGLVQTSEQRLHGHEQTGGRPQNMEHGAGGQSQNTGQRLQEHRHSQPGGQYQNISQRPRDNGHQNVGRRATEHAKPRGDNPPKRRKQTGPGPRGKNTKPRAKSSQPTPTIAIQEIIDLCQDDDESVKPEPGLLESDHSGQNWTQTNRGRAQNSRPQTRGPPHVPSTLEANSEVGASGIMGIAVNKLGAQNEKLMKELGNVNHELQYKSRMLDQAEAKIVELTNSLETRNKVKAEISNQISTMRKFLDGVGSDYDRLNHMNIEWRNKLKEATTEKMIIEQDLAEVRVALQKANFDAQAWNNGKADAQSIQAELVELRIHAERTEKELGDRAGNLAEARNRVQELEAKILDDRKANRVIVESFQETKAHLVDTLVELQKTMFEKFQDGDATRTDRLHDCIENIGQIVSAHDTEIKASISSMEDTLRSGHAEFKTGITAIEHTFSIASQSTGNLASTLREQLDAATAEISQTVQSKISEGLVKSQENAMEQHRQANESYRAAVDARLQLSEARREESEARRHEYELRCNDLVIQLERYQASEDVSRQRIVRLEAELSGIVRIPKDNQYPALLTAVNRIEQVMEQKFIQAPEVSGDLERERSLNVSIKRELDSKQAQFEAIQKELEVTRKHLEAKKDVVDAKMTELGAKQKEMDKLLKLNGQTLDLKQKLQSELDVLAKENDKAAKSEQELRLRMQSQKIQLDSLVLQVKEAALKEKKGFSKTEQDFQKRMQVLQSELDGLVKENKEIKETGKALRDDLAAKQAELDAKRTELDTKQAELDTKQAELDAKQIEMDKFLKDGEASAWREEELEQERANLQINQTEIETLVVEKEALEARIATFEKERTEYMANAETNAMSFRQKETQKSKAEIDNLKLKINRMERRAREKSESSNESAEMMATIKFLESEKISLTEKLETSEAEITRITGIFNVNERLILSIENRNDKLAQELANAKSQLAKEQDALTNGNKSCELEIHLLKENIGLLEVKIIELEKAKALQAAELSASVDAMNGLKNELDSHKAKSVETTRELKMFKAKQTSDGLTAPIMPSRFDSTRPQYNRFSGSSSAPESDGTTIPEPQMTMANWETPVLRGSGFSSGYENDEASLISGGTPKAPLIFSTAVVRRSEMLPPSTPQNYSIGPNTTTQKRKRPRITGAASKPAQSAEGGPSDKTATATIAKSRVQDKSTANTTPVMSKYFSTSKQTDQQKEIHEKGTGELGTATSSKRHLTPWPEEPPEADTTPVAKKVAKRTGTTVGTRVRKPAVPRKK